MISRKKKQLLDLIKRNGKLSLEKAIDETGLTKTTLREHFTQLERDGYVIREYVRQGPGRPGLQYQLSANGQTFYPSHEPELLKELISYLKSRGLKSVVEGFFRQYWENRADKAEQLMDQASESDPALRIAALKEMLESEGFMPEFQIDDQNETITLTECNCPFREVVKETRLPCQLEEQFFKSVCGDEVQRTGYIPDGDHACSYDISKKSV